MQGRLDTLTKTFHAYSPAFSTDPQAPQLERGGKVFLPQSFLQEVTRSSLVYPLQLLVQTRYRKYVYCGVLSFVAPEGQVIMPYWMLKHLQIDEGTVVQIQTVSLPKASIIKLRPHQKLFTELSNPRAVLESSLKNYTCLTKGTTISVFHADTTFDIDVTDIKGAKGADEKAVLVVDSDVKVDFERPLDMPPTPPRSPVQSPFSVANGVIGGGGGASAFASIAGPVPGSASVASGTGGIQFGLDGYTPPVGGSGAMKGPPTAASATAGDPVPVWKGDQPKFSAFTGCGKNLKGQVIPPAPAPAPASSSSSSAPSVSKTPTPAPVASPPATSGTASAGATATTTSGGGGGGGRQLGSGGAKGPAAASPFLEALARRQQMEKEKAATAAAASASATASTNSGAPTFTAFSRKLKE